MPNLTWGSNYAFSAYSLKHAVVLITMTTAAFALVTVGRHIAPARRRVAEKCAGVLLAAIWLVGFLFDFANPRATASTTLPLHWCDLCGLLAPIVMLAPQYRVPRAVLHFWALCMCSFAFLMPVIGLGPNFVDFWIYFGTHAAILLTAVYDRGVRGFVPERRDIAWAWGLAAAWVVALQPVNLALHANYGFVGADDQHVRKVIRALGTWPWRLVPMLAINFAMMVVAMVTQQAIAAAFRWMARPAVERDTRSLPFPQAQPQQSMPRAA